MKAGGTQVLIGTRNNQFSGNSWFWYFDTDCATNKDHPQDFAQSTCTCTDGDGHIVYKRSDWLWSAVSEGRSYSNTFTASLLYDESAPLLIDPLALPGDSNSATLSVLYERYSGKPLQCGGGCYLGSAYADLPVSVTAVSEPAPQALQAAGLAAMAWLQLSAARRRRG